MIIALDRFVWQISAWITHFSLDCMFDWCFSIKTFWRYRKTGVDTNECLSGKHSTVDQCRAEFFIRTHPQQQRWFVKVAWYIRNNSADSSRWQYIWVDLLQKWWTQYDQFRSGRTCCRVFEGKHRTRFFRTHPQHAADVGTSSDRHARTMRIAASCQWFDVAAVNSVHHDLADGSAAIEARWRIEGGSSGILNCMVCCVWRGIWRQCGNCLVSYELYGVMVQNSMVSYELSATQTITSTIYRLCAHTGWRQRGVTESHEDLIPPDGSRKMRSLSS